MSKNAVIALACQIVKLREAARMWKQTAQAHKDQRDIQAANHETRMAELRSSMGVRIDADAQLITSLQAMVKEQSNSAKTAGDLLGWTENESPLQAVERVVKERDALRAEVTDLRRVFDMVHGSLGIRQGDHIGHAIDRLKSDKLELFNARQRIMAELAVVKDEWDTLRTERDGLLTQVQDMRAELERLKKPARKHPVAVGEWVKRTGNFCHWGRSGEIAQVLIVGSSCYGVQRQCGDTTDWDFAYCEPCDPPTEATHDTPAGKAAAESVVEVVRTEPDEIKVGDVVEVFRDSSGNTLKTDVGIIGKVLKLYSDSIDGERLVMLDPESQNRQSEGGCHYALCDVRKVTP